MLEAEAAPNLATETKYSLVKNTIVRAEKPVEDVEELIACDNIYVESEETVVDAVKLWCNNETRREHRARLMAHVKLSNLSSDSLDSLVQHNLISSSLSLQREVQVEKSRSRGLNKFIVVMALSFHYINQ